MELSDQTPRILHPKRKSPPPRITEDEATSVPEPVYMVLRRKVLFPL
jgi:hypothetical protein